MGTGFRDLFQFINGLFQHLTLTEHAPEYVGKELWYLSRLPMIRQRLTCSILKRNLWNLH